jgi:asparagine synthase (glutamine-hydrolysing)
LKIFGIFDPDRTGEDLAPIMARMSRRVDPLSTYQSESLALDGIAVGRSFSRLTDKDQQPIWNEERTRFIVMNGNIFDYERKREELARKGHHFAFPRSDAEFVLHAFEEWGPECLQYLDGYFSFAIHDVERQRLTIANDRYGVTPIYYYHNRPSFTFSSAVSAVLEDGRVKRDIDWSAWGDLFRYKYILGTRTFFKGLHNLRNAMILTITSDGLVSRCYWNFTQVQIDHNKTEKQFVDIGARLMVQAIRRRCGGLQKCIVLLSGGYDSRSMSTLLARFTKVDLETFTSDGVLANTSCGAYVPHWLLLHLDAVLSGRIAKRLGITNTRVPIPSDLWEKYFVQKTLLVEALCQQHLWILPLVDELPHSGVALLDLANNTVFNNVGGWVQRERQMNIHDLRSVARTLDRDMAPEIPEFFDSPVRDELCADSNSLMEELERIGDHENILTIFGLQNEVRNLVSLLPNNIVNSKVPCIFPFLDKDLVEFALSIPPSMKFRQGRIYHKILRRLFPDVMRIPSVAFRLNSHSLQGIAMGHLTLAIEAARCLIVTRICDARRKQMHQTTEYLISLITSEKPPSFLDVNKVVRKAREYMFRKKDPSNWLVAIAEFCIWYNRFFRNENSRIQSL